MKPSSNASSRCSTRKRSGRNPSYNRAFTLALFTRNLHCAVHLCSSVLGAPLEGDLAGSSQDEAMEDGGCSASSCASNAAQELRASYQRYEAHEAHANPVRLASPAYPQASMKGGESCSFTALHSKSINELRKAQALFKQSDKFVRKQINLAAFEVQSPAR